MNIITKAERDALLMAAKLAVSLDDAGEIVGGFTQVWQAFVAEHGISDQRARSYIAKAARIKRGETVTEPGHPRTLEDASRVTVYLSPADVQIASVIGQGNISAGMRLALAQASKE